MRSTVDLIKELKNERGNFTGGAALIIGFENTSILIFADEDANAGLKKLNDAVSHDGESVGLIGWDSNNGLLSVQVRPLVEYQEEKWAKDYLAALADQLKQIIAEKIKNSQN